MTDIESLAAERDHALDQLRYLAAEVYDRLRFRAVRIRSMLDRDDCDPELFSVILEDFEELRKVLNHAVAACTDEPYRYSDGGPVVADVDRDDWGGEVFIAEPPHRLGASRSNGPPSATDSADRV